MRKIVLIFVTVVLPCLLCARNDDKSTDALLRQIDGIIKNRQTYGAEKEARVADLKKLLSEATSDEQRYGFCGRLFDEYRPIIWILLMYMHKESRIWLLIWENKIIWMIPR